MYVLMYTRRAKIKKREIVRTNMGAIPTYEGGGGITR